LYARLCCPTILYIQTGITVTLKYPLPFVEYCFSKNFYAVYYSGIYSDPDLMKWFTSEYPNMSRPNWIWARAVYVLKR